MSNKATRVLKTASITAIFLGLLVAAGYFYWRYQQLASQNPEREIASITKKLRQFMDLPESPLPTMATVTEKEKLQQQEFFQKAENGDKVLIYLTEGKAILYRPSTGKVIDVAPVRQTESPQNESAETSKNAAEAETDTPIAITLYNGTNISGATRTIESDLAELSFDYTVNTRTNAARANYTKTIVVDLDSTHAEQAKELAQLLSGTVESLPAGEQKPEAGGLLIIVGQEASPSPTPTAAPAE